MTGLGESESAVTPVIESVLLLGMIVAIVTSLVIWVLPVIDQSAAIVDKNSAINGLNGVNNVIGDVITGGEGTTLTSAVPTGAGTFTVNEQGDRIAPTYTLDPNYDFNITGIDDYDDEITIEMSQGNATKAAVFWDLNKVADAAWNWWDTSWHGEEYFTPITIDNTMNPTTTLTDYQINVTIDTATLIAEGKLQPTGADLRFFDSDNVSMLSYWIESGINTPSTKIWIKIPEIPAGAIKTISLRYNNPSALPMSSIDSTMDEGLRYFYYDGMNFNTFKGTDVDTSLYHEWSLLERIKIVGNTWEDQFDTMSIRWEGWVINRGTGSHTFYVTSDDGQRLYVNGTLITNAWSDGVRELSGAYSFSSPTPIRLEFYENMLNAKAELGWAPADGSGKVYPIPVEYLKCRKYTEMEPIALVGAEVLSNITLEMDWNYRLPVIVDSGNYPRTNYTVEQTVNFENELYQAGISGTVDEDSIRVVEYDHTGEVIGEVPSQVSPQDQVQLGKEGIITRAHLRDASVLGTSPVTISDVYGINATEVLCTIPPNSSSTLGSKTFGWFWLSFDYTHIYNFYMYPNTASTLFIDSNKNIFVHLVCYGSTLQLGTVTYLIKLYDCTNLTADTSEGVFIGSGTYIKGFTLFDSEFDANFNLAYDSTWLNSGASIAPGHYIRAEIWVSASAIGFGIQIGVKYNSTAADSYIDLPLYSDYIGVKLYDSTGTVEMSQFGKEYAAESIVIKSVDAIGSYDINSGGSNLVILMPDGLAATHIVSEPPDNKYAKYQWRWYYKEDSADLLSGKYMAQVDTIIDQHGRGFTSESYFIMGGKDILVRWVMSGDTAPNTERWYAIYFDITAHGKKYAPEYRTTDNRVSKLWEYNTGVTVPSSPAIADIDNDGKAEIVVGSASWETSNPPNRNMFALNGENGTLLWSYAQKGGFFSSPAISDVDDDAQLDVVIGSGTGFATSRTIAMLNGYNGSATWNYVPGKDVLSSPAIADINEDGYPNIVIGSHDGQVYAFNPDGSIIWQKDTKEGGGTYDIIMASPAIADVNLDDKLEVIISACYWSAGGSPTAKKLYVLNGETGQELWTFSKMSGFSSSAAIADINSDGIKEIAVVGYDGIVYVLSGINGNQVWSYSIGAVLPEPASSPAIADVNNDGTLDVIVGSNDGLYALTGMDGKLIWKFSWSGSASSVSSPAIADVNNDGMLDVIVGSDAGDLYAVSGENGNIVWKYTTGDTISSSPSIGDINGDGNVDIVFGSNDGKVYALTAGRNWSTWPMFRHDLRHTGVYNYDPHPVTLTLKGVEEYGKDIAFYYINAYPGHPAHLTLSKPLTGAMCLDLYNESVKIGRMWLFDLGKIEYERDSMSGTFGAILENGAIVDASPQSTFMRGKPTTIMEEDSTFFMKMTQIKSSAATSGTNIPTLFLTFNETTYRESKTVEVFRISVYGDDSKIWLDYLLKNYGFIVNGNTATYPTTGVTFKMTHSIVDVGIS